MTTVSQRLTEDIVLDAIDEVVKTFDACTYALLADHLGCSRTTAYYWVGKLKSASKATSSGISGSIRAITRDSFR